MKLRKIFTALAAAVLAFVGCQEEERFLDEVQVSQSLIALPIEGGSAEITVTAADKWEITGIPEWLTVTPASGAAGETKVTFSAAAAEDNQEVKLSLNCGYASQVITVFQMAEKVELPVTDCATVLKENSVGSVYKCKGTITDLTNYGKYGCFYINDGTATVYVYGSMNYQQFEPEVGDIITFEGPWTSYGNFDDVTILDLEKSLIKLEAVLPDEPISLEGGKVTVLLTVKSGDLVVEIPEDASWLTAGEPGNLGGMTSVELTAAANTSGARTATVTFKTTVDGKDYIAMADVEQLGAISKVTVAEFIAAAEGAALYELTGKVSAITSAYNPTYGNISFKLMDSTGEVAIYRMTCPEGATDLAVGDIVTVCGARSSYNGTPQMAQGETYVSHVSSTVATVAEFLAQPTGDTWYKLTGTISNIVKDKNDATKDSAYGNFDLTDETGTVYVYGLTVAPVASNDQSFPKLGLKEGDKVTLIGKRAEYKGSAQVGGPAYYISHESAGNGDNGDNGDNGENGDNNETPAGDFASNVVFGTVSSAYVDGVATVNGVENVATLKLGTSKLYGEGTVTLPAGTTKVSCYAVAWKNNPAKLEFSVGGTVLGTQEIAANDGATSNSPYTITVTESDHYTITLPVALPTDTVVTVKTIETGYRAILFGVVAE